MSPKKKKTKKAVKPTTSKDPQFEKLIKQALSCVGPENTQPDSTVYTEGFLREWLTIERAKRPSNFDYHPDYTHLKNLAIWDHVEMAGVLFGITWEGFMHMAGIIRICGALKLTGAEERVYFTQRTNRVKKLGWYPIYEWMPEIKDWYIPANQAREKFDEILSRGCNDIPGLGWKESEQTRYFIIKDFMPWLMNQQEILLWLKDEGCRIPSGLETFLGHWGSKAEATPTEEPVNEPVDPEAFVKSLKFYYLEPDVFISEAGKRPIRFTLESMGFHQPTGITAKDFISILRGRNGPEYDLGPSHSYLDSAGRNIKDVGSSDTYDDSPGDEDLDDQISSGISEVPQKIENSDYRVRQQRRDSISKKIFQFIEKEFKVTLGDGFKLYEITPEAKPGMCKFKFKNRKITAVDPESYSGMTLEQTLIKLKILSQTEKTEDFDVNDNNTIEAINLCQHALKLGASELEIDQFLDPRNHPLYKK